MEKIESLETLVISQQKEWSEILTGFEAVNNYIILDTDKNPLYVASEWDRSFLERIFLKSLRPFTIYISDLDGKRLLILHRSFKFYFHKLEVYDPNWNYLGAVERRFSVFQRRYSVLNNLGYEIFHLFGPIIHPWTFLIKTPDREIGKITKKWSGLLKEAFTKTDNFGITFPADLKLEYKIILLGAVFLIDFVHFEKDNN
ncbi:scramblase [Candidatus Poribacteria bacterium]|nr:scramblase [Candidatus Poribacteria bacterium]